MGVPFGKVHAELSFLLRSAPSGSLLTHRHHRVSSALMGQSSPWVQDGCKQSLAHECRAQGMRAVRVLH